MAIITEELLVTGESSRGAFSRKQIELLGLSWPPASGWRRALIGQEISAEAAEAFIGLADHHLIEKTERKQRAESLNWFGSATPIDIHLYVLELENSHYYVGLTADIQKRMQQHFTGEGAEWTKLHRPVRVMHTVCTGTKKMLEAERMEDEVTIALMHRFGVSKVRGGHFIQLEQEETDRLLRSRGVWDSIKQTGLSHQHFDTEANWSEALDNLLDKALSYYDAGSPGDQADELFAACYKLTRYRYWSEDFAPGLGWAFWNPKGILPVLLSFKLGRPVASRLRMTFEILAGAMCRGRDGHHPLRRLFLLGWQAYCPSCTDNQAQTLERYIGYLNDPVEYDRQYDAFVSVLFPEMRYLLRRE